MKKIAVVLLSLLMLALVCVPAGAAAATPADSAHLHVKEDGSFRVLNFSDIQDDMLLSNLTARFIEHSIEQYKPDLIVLTGDNIAGYRCLTKSSSEKAIRAFMEVFERMGVPVALVFGNHDDEGQALSKAEQMKIYRDYSVTIAFDEAEYFDADLSGVGTYYVPVYESAASNKVKFVLWMFDSGSDDAVEDADNYDHVHNDQISWFKTESARLNAAAGETVYGLAFQHIIVNEVYAAFAEASARESGAVPYLGKWYKLPSNAISGSYLGEAPCPSYGNEGQFGAMKDSGSVLATVCGHDHANSFVIPYEGVDIVCTPTCGFCSYGDKATRGARVIDLNANKPAEYETFTFLFTDIEKDNLLINLEYGFVAFWKQVYLLLNNLMVLIRETLSL